MPTLQTRIRLGAVELTVTDLDRSVAFYQDAIGLRLHRRDDAAAAMGAGGADLVVLHESPFAPAAGRHAGLYHFALLCETREELARAILRIAAGRFPVDGLSDHGTHEALYLPDPDGNGIELAWDRPRDRWPDLRYLGGPAPLDTRAVLATVAGEAPIRHADAGLRMGHVHLHVGDLEAARHFYRDGLGLTVMTDLGSAVFAAFDGYHHHVAFNLWRGPGVPPAPAGSVGLRHWTLSVDDLAATRARLEAIGAEFTADGDALLARDPAGIAVRLVSS